MALPTTLTGLVYPANGGYCGPWRFPGDSVESWSSTSNPFMFGSTAFEKLAQSFQLSSQTNCAAVAVRLNRSGSPTDAVRVSVQADSSGEPSGSELLGATVDIQKTSYGWYVFDFGSAYTLSASTTYWIVMGRTGSLDGSNYYQTRGSLVGGYPDGVEAYYASGSWTIESSYDIGFHVLDDTEKFYVLGLDSTDQTRIEVHKGIGSGAADETQQQLLDGAGPVDFGDENGTKRAQSFQMSTASNVHYAYVKIDKDGTPTNNVEVSIQSDSSGEPSGTKLATTTKAPGDVSTSQTWERFDYATPASLSASTTYWIVVEAGTGTAVNKYNAGNDSTNPYASGGMFTDAGSGWGANTGYDLAFSVNGWMEQDAGNAPDFASGGDIVALSGHIEHDPENDVQYGALIHIVSQQYDSSSKDRPAALCYHTFNMLDDTWGTTEESVYTPDLDDAVASSYVGADITVRSTGDIIIFAATDSVKSNSYVARVAYFLNDGSWNSPVSVDNGGSVHWIAGAVVLGSSDRVHFLFEDKTSLDVYQRTLSAADNLETFPSAGDSDAEIDRTGSRGSAVSYDDSGTQRVRMAYMQRSYYAALAEFDSADEPGAFTANVVGDNIASTTIASTRITIANDGTDVYTLYVTSSGSDIYLDLNDATDSGPLTSGLANFVSANIYDRSTLKRLAYVYQDSGTLYYDEYDLEAPAASLIEKSRFRKLQLLLVR